MSIKVKKDNLLINQIEITKNEICEIEGECIVPDVKPDVISLITTSGILSVNKKEISEGKIRIFGTITAYIMYRGNEGENTSIRSVNHTIDFSQIITAENANSQMRDISSITLKSIEGKMINERKIRIKAQVDFNIKLHNNCNVEYVEGIEEKNVQRLEKSIMMNSVVGIGNTKTNINETISTNGDEKLVEILKVDSSISNIETKISYNKILIKSDLYITLLYSTENGRYDRIQSKFPVMGFIEMKDINEECIINPNIQISNFVLNTNGSQDNSIVVDIDIEMGVIVYNNKKISIIEDMYCPSKCLKISKKNIKIQNNNRECKGIYSINRKELLDIGEEKIYETNPVVMIEKTKIENDYVWIIGNIRIDIIHSTSRMTSIGKRYVNIPFEYKMKCEGVKVGDSIEINYCIKNQSIDMISRGEMEVKLDIEFYSKSTNIKNIELIDNVEEGKEKNSNKYNVVIYYTKKGDKLWNIAKQFDSTKDEIISENKIEGDKLKEGMQLFITK